MRAYCTISYTYYFRPVKECSYRSLLPKEETKPQHRLQDSHSIVPKGNGSSTPAAINSRFQLHHVQANTRKIYIRDFAQNLQNMLEDSGYKFSEEYEVCAEIIQRKELSLVA